MVNLSDIKDYNHARISEEDFNLIRDTAKGYYVEVGTFHGASAYAASQNANEVWSIDIYNWQPKVSDNPKIHYVKGTSEDFVGTNEKAQWIDVLFIDASHEYDYVLRDCNALIPLVKKGGVIMFDDYVPNSTGVYPAVNEAIKKYNLTIIKETSPNCNILVCKI